MRNDANGDLVLWLACGGPSDLDLSDPAACDGLNALVWGALGAP